MALTNEDLQAIAKMLKPIHDSITDIRLHLENVTDRNISLLAENHGNLIDKLNQSIKVADKSTIDEIRVNILTEKVNKLEKELAEIKNRIA
ncbi:hypothetical protein [Clostridium sp. AM58-1XD]|uniref:hypothetical protein n=1 Tax=Clostridium sp. AM58-1XD TaxID=2292307 RepID=UPI000E50EC25|nr:hypothetical protein [Clostridium sp. AM58-1XD]RGY98365.1 hypothetical protein DXA13_11160 [Clostridium sp. AM58-1XD]